MPTIAGDFSCAPSGFAIWTAVFAVLRGLAIAARVRTLLFVMIRHETPFCIDDRPLPGGAGIQPPYIGISARHGGLIKKSPGLFELVAMPQTSEGKVRVTKRCSGLETLSGGATSGDATRYEPPGPRCGIWLVAKVGF